MIDNNIRQPSKAVENRLLYDTLFRLIDTNLNIYMYTSESLREKCPNKEVFLVRIFPNLN